MPAFSVNFSDVQSFEALPAGVYSVAIIDMEEVSSSPSGFPYFKVTMEILDGEFAGRRQWSNLSLSPKAMWKLQEALIAFGESPDSLTGEFDFDPEKYLGVECLITVTQTTYEGKISNTVEAFLPAGTTPAASVPGGRETKASARKAKKPSVR